MKVVVTGGAGFIGANLLRVLEGNDAAKELVACDDLSTGSRSNLDAHSRTTLVEADILDRAALAAACEGADCIVHLAARGSVPRSLEDPLASHHANTTGTVHVLEAARANGSHVVVASSSSVYGARAVKRMSTPVLSVSSAFAPASGTASATASRLTGTGQEGPRPRSVADAAARAMSAAAIVARMAAEPGPATADPAPAAAMRTRLLRTRRGATIAMDAARTRAGSQRSTA